MQAKAPNLVNDDRKLHKICARCGRNIHWRKKWAKNWAAVKFCSKACQSAGLSKTDRDLEAMIIKLLQQRKAGASICPSEAAIAIAGKDAVNSWRPLMETARQAARRLVAQGAIEITQHGRAVDPSTAKGPIRLRLVR